MKTTLRICAFALVTAAATLSFSTWAQSDAALAAARLPEVGLFKVPLYPRRGPFWVHQAPHRWIKSLKDATSYKPVASYSIVGRAVIRLGRVDKLLHP